MARQGSQERGVKKHLDSRGVSNLYQSSYPTHAHSCMPDTGTCLARAKRSYNFLPVSWGANQLWWSVNEIPANSSQSEPRLATSHPALNVCTVSDRRDSGLSPAHSVTDLWWQRAARAAGEGVDGHVTVLWQPGNLADWRKCIQINQSYLLTSFGRFEFLSNVQS